MNDMQHEPGEAEEVVVQDGQEDQTDTQDGQEPEGSTGERAWSSEAEEEARVLGWKAPDEWQGEKPAGYIDNPEEYLQRLERLTPFRKARELHEADKAAWEDRFRRLERMQETAMNRMKADYEAKMQEIQAGKMRAVEEADTEAYRNLTQQEQALAKQHREMQDAPAQPSGPPPEVTQYVQQNAWTKNPLLWKAAIEAVDLNPEVQKKTPGEQLAYAEEQVRQIYPHLFEQPKAKQQRQMVDGGGLAGGMRKSEFDKLPSEAKQQFQKFVEQGLFSNDDAGKKDYVNAYNEA